MHLEFQIWHQNICRYLYLNTREICISRFFFMNLCFLMLIIIYLILNFLMILILKIILQLLPQLIPNNALKSTTKKDPAYPPEFHITQKKATLY